MKHIALDSASSTAFRPSSPSLLSPASAARIPSSRSNKPHSSSIRSENLHLPGLPRFHPANYPSAQPLDLTTTTALQGLSAIATASGNGSAGPRPQRSVADSQRYLAYAAGRPYTSPNSLITSSPSSSLSSSPSASSHATNTSRNKAVKPRSPRLHPLGSPGPVTPLELEEEGVDGYLNVRGLGGSGGGSCSSLDSIADMQGKLVDALREVEEGQGRRGARI